MGNTCACVRHSEVGSPSRRGGPAALEGEQGTSSVVASVECDGRDVRSGNVRSVVEERIERSKKHWSELTELESDLDDEEVAEENRQVFGELQSHPTWGYFFKTFSYYLYPWSSSGEMEVGEKFAEGGQAELFHAKVIWKYSCDNEEDLEAEREWVIKVFKKGTRLSKLQSQWPLGFLQLKAQQMEDFKLNLPPSTQDTCDVHCGILLEDGRFAFLLKKEHEDLRSRIDRKMLRSSSYGPFSKDEAERIIFRIALGMDSLHKHNIIHRDLKASNVLVCKKKGYHARYYVADFECSVGVVGTGFFRAPEILQALKNGVANSNLEVFSKGADVYSYGMTCYEVLTGRVPFESHPFSDYDVVLDGYRPKISEFVDDWMIELVKRCWDKDCSKRPSFSEIIEILLTNSIAAREFQSLLQRYEEDYNREHEERLLHRVSFIEDQ